MKRKHQEEVFKFEFGYTNETIKAFLERTETSAESSESDRDKLRWQLMGLTLTVSASLTGLGLSVANHRFLLVVPIFCLFMHLLDALLQDLSERQNQHRQKLNECLLGSDSWDDAARSKVLEIGIRGNEPKDFCKKVCLFIYGGLFEAVWHWGLFFGTLAIFIFLH